MLARLGRSRRSEFCGVYGQRFIRQAYDAQTAVIAGGALKLDGEFCAVQFTIKFDVFDGA